MIAPYIVASSGQDSGLLIQTDGKVEPRVDVIKRRSGRFTGVEALR